MTGLVLAGCFPPGEKNDELESLVAAAAGADVVARARTGGRPDGLPGVVDALDELRRAGCSRALVVSTHLVPGELHRCLELAAASAAAGFDELRLAAPLIANEKDALAVAAALAEALPARAGRTVLLAGHRGDAASLTWLALERAFQRLGRVDALVGAPDALVARAGEAGREVLLAPLLMELGVHARRDVLGALRERLEASGVTVEPWPHALSELPAVRELLVAHALAAPALPNVKRGTVPI